MRDSWEQQLTALGPYFALSSPPAGDEQVKGGWRQLADLLAPPVLEERVENTRRLLTERLGRAIDDRVAASTMAFGLCSRLISPLIGAAALGVDLPPMSLASLSWRPVVAGPWPMALVGEPAPVDPGACFNALIVPIHDAVARLYSLSPKVLAGNAASAIFGAVKVIESTQPHLAPNARAQGLALFDAVLPEAGWHLDRDAPTVSFVRNSCCLYYRALPNGYCGDCVLGRRANALG